ncbi:hypothetical protein NKR19_g5461 [Coniochaeta hoffmannii]|uniref:Uncharacterized protein n=1 Tax=Coniochaeta hoffmannii TaxID=91930 RepID=A0AA38RX59_9PEZI|nr:hypothetical protein NKR19_g5461 [Coniochaeta hoffmannii]
MPSFVKPEIEPHKPYPPYTHAIGGATCTLGMLPLTQSSKAGRPQAPPPPPPPHSKRTTLLATRTINALLLRSACHLASYSGPSPPTERPISLHDPLHPVLQALRAADQACSFALAWQSSQLIAKAHLFRGHAYRAIGLWDMAYEAYVKAASYPDFARDRSGEGLEALTRYCAEMRDGRKRSSRRGEVKGLFRCGTFGDLGGKMKLDAAVGAGEKQEHEEQMVKHLICEEDRGAFEDGGRDGNGSAEGDGRGNKSRTGREGHLNGDDECDIDWLTIGNTDQPGGDTPNRKAAPRPGYPPLRSTRGKLVPSRTMCISPNQ